MNERVNIAAREGVSVITIDNPPVNALSPGVPEGILRALDAAARDAATGAVVIIGGGRTFIAGADIRELEQAALGRSQEAPNLRPLLRKIEDCPKPVVMAIHGTALGGGLEVAMAGHYRVAARDAQLGQPEVNLGIIPGAEGTQRLPRLVGIAAAVDLCVSGKPVPAAEALRLGLIDAVIEGDLLAGAVEFAKERARSGGPHRRTRDRNERLGSAEENAPLFQAGREQARKTRRNMLAPLAAVDALEAAATLPFEEGCRKERELVAGCLASDQAKALIHAFFAERAVSKIPDVPKDTPVRPIRKAAILGAGTMGSGIAMAMANAGISVMLTDADEAAVDRGMANIRKNYESSVKKGRFPQNVMDQRMALIRPQAGREGFETADLIVEAVFENLELKKQVFAEIDRVARPDCVLASNTSTLDIDEIAAATKRPEQVIGLHFFSPAHVMRLVEIVRGKATAKDVIATSLALAKALRKVGVVVGNCRGFVGNRMMLPYMREAQFLVEEGATPAQVDKALYDWGMAMGIFAVDDMGGIDVQWHVRQEAKPFEKAGPRQPLVLGKLYEMGRLGQKTGSGWYRYDENRRAVPDPEIEALIEQTARDAGIRRRAISDAEIIERCIYIMINEGARILEEGHALRAADIDTIYLAGYGFPAYRGGPMWYADTVGLIHVYNRIQQFHGEHGEFWEPAPLLRQLAEESGSFADYDASRRESVSAA
ncbi:MAG TPA: 3-hydroxyacyl-CoA dehydrogenase NAD-binding domain-containing protein [Bryobacteraceae bacterium]|nr:3-hydroxyacyl-CoA dehydrogenase NAD-binding domain-containing protein [Bryobacteraceae bacterium]